MSKYQMSSWKRVIFGNSELRLCSYKKKRVILSCYIQCRCPYCHQEDGSTTSSVYGYDSISINQNLSCYLSPASGPRRQVIWHRTSTSVIVNVMLWPTILIITGFVSMIFSWIYMQYDEKDREKARKPHIKYWKHVIMVFLQTVIISSGFISMTLSWIHVWCGGER